MSYAFPVVLTVLILVSALCLYRFIRECRHKVQAKFGPQYFSISYGEKWYAATQGVSIRPCIPTSANPRWLVITILPSELRDSTSHIAFTKLIITCRFFPLTLRRHQSQAWFSVELDDFTLRIYHSRHTPLFVQKLRDNLISALLTGDIVRINEIKIKAVFDSSKLVDNPTEEGHTIITMQTEGWNMHTWKPRIYDVAKVDAHMRAGNEERPSSLSIVALDCNYMKEPGLPQCNSMLTRLLWEAIYFPFGFARFLWSPITAVDLRLSRVDVTFDAFRLRDADLVVKVGAKLRDEYQKNADILNAAGWSVAFSTMSAILSY